MPKSQKPDGAVAGSAERLASRFYQLKTWHPRTGQYLHWVKVRPDAQCWWCKCLSQTTNHLFKVCPEWKMQHMILWAEMLQDTKEWKNWWTVRDCWPMGDVGGQCWTFSPPRTWEGWCHRWKRKAAPQVKCRSGSSGSAGSGRRSRREREALGAVDDIGDGEELPWFLRTPSFMASAGEE